MSKSVTFHGRLFFVVQHSLVHNQPLPLKMQNQNSLERLMACFFSSIGIVAAVFLANSILRWKRMGKSRVSQPARFDLEKLAPYPNEKIKGFEKHRIRMSLKKMDRINWLTVDKNYKALHSIRKELLKTQRRKMVQCLPEAKDVCQEALHEVSKFLCKRYPAMFEMDNAEKIIRNKEVGEQFQLSNGWNESMPPLEMAARLAMDDFTIILRNEEGMHYMWVSN